MNAWSYVKPRTAGSYFVNHGDVVSKYTLEIVHFNFDKDGGLVDGDLVDVGEYHHTYKFMENTDNEEITESLAHKLNLIGNGPVLESIE
jgi:hypothetical protein